MKPHCKQHHSSIYQAPQRDLARPAGKFKRVQVVLVPALYFAPYRDAVVPLLRRARPTWLLLPIDLFADMLSARNLGTYRLEDLPKTHREEIEACVNVYIDVDDKTHFWNRQPLFVFDDTLIHRSANDADQVRYCLFMDIVRPNHLQPAFGAAISVAAVIASSFKTIFYKNWSFIR